LYYNIYNDDLNRTDKKLVKTSQMVPQNNYTTQLNETEETFDDYVPTESSQDYENGTNDQENARVSTFSSLISGANSVAFDVTSYWANVC
jgi:hypothetical protein